MPTPDMNWLQVLNSLILLAIIGGAAIKYSSWKGSEEKRKREATQEREATIVRVCREFTNSVEYRTAKDQRIKEVADSRIDDAFRQRAESFVDAKVYMAEMKALRSDLARISEDIKENTAAVAEMSGRLALIVLRDSDDTSRRRIRTKGGE